METSNGDSRSIALGIARDLHLWGRWGTVIGAFLIAAAIMWLTGKLMAALLLGSGLWVLAWGASSVAQGTILIALQKQARTGSRASTEQAEPVEA